MKCSRKPASSPYCPDIILLTRDYNKKKTFSLTLPVMGDDFGYPGGEDFHVKRTGMFVGLKAIVLPVGVFSLKGSTVGTFPVCFGYWAEYIYKPHPQYGILVFLRSSLPTSTPLFKWESSHCGWMIGSLHDRKKRLKGSTDSGRLCVALATLTYYFLDLMSSKWSANTSDWSPRKLLLLSFPIIFQAWNCTVLNTVQVLN